LSEKGYHFSDKYQPVIPVQSIENKVKNRIYGKGRGWSFSKIDFADLANVSSVDRALSRLQKAGTIRRVLRGLYDYPRYSKLLEQSLSPDIDQVAQALARKFGWTIQVSGNAALNILGLSTQVPTQYLFHSDGKSKTYKIGTIELQFKKTKFKNIRFKYSESELLVQGLTALGKNKITPSQRHKIAEYFPQESHKRILKDTRYSTSWVYDEIKQIFSEST